MLDAVRRLRVNYGLLRNVPDAISVIAVKFAGEPHRMNELNSAAWLDAQAK